jgi:6-pyruvoyltetrahydropterin/6-carboxytetrahydropterin synthase
MRLRLGRTYRFEAAHRLFTPRLDSAENERLYGKCARPGGHGHNYEVEICLDGELERGQSTLIERTELDAKVRALLLERVDHRNLDEVLSPLVTTGENLAQTFFEWLAPAFAGPARLYRLRVRETRNNRFETIRPGNR